MVSATSCCLDSPAMLAERRPRRTRTSLCSNIGACSAVRLRFSASHTAPESSLNTAIHGLRSRHRRGSYSSAMVSVITKRLINLLLRCLQVLVHLTQVQPRWVKPLSRFVEVVMGLALASFTLFCLGCSLFVAWAATSDQQILAAGLGVALVLICFWVLSLAVRLIFNLPNRGGLMGPLSLRVLAAIFFFAPAIGAFTGFYYGRGWRGILQAIFYFLFAIGFWETARRRALHQETK